jgi:histidyl-tRNA synthetase
MNDMLPDTIGIWQYVEACAKETLDLYGYQELRFPIVEKTELFSRSIGEVTDIVEKEMYTFEDRNGDSLTLRPEGTAGCVRAGIQNGLLHNQVHRFWYSGPMFRHERPQKGRYRQFHQIGVEAFGLAGPDIDAELILLSSRFWKVLAMHHKLSLEINTIGSSEERTLYKIALLEYLQTRKNELDEDSIRRLDTNPLRILDSKSEATQKVVADAPQFDDYLGDESRDHFQSVLNILDSAGIKYTINTRLVRGLDYYSKTVFEWSTDELGAQGTVCAGGRYDMLVQQLGGKETPAIGMAIGMERLVALCDDRAAKQAAMTPQVYVVSVGAGAEQIGLKIAELLREECVRVVSHCGGGSMKQQMKQADRSGAEYALILADEEISKEVVTVKMLRKKGEQQQVNIGEIVEFIRSK